MATPDSPPPSPALIAAPAAEPFGLGRMFAAYAETEGKQVGIFRTMEGAEDWLDLPRGTVDELRWAFRHRRCTSTVLVAK